MLKLIVYFFNKFETVDQSIEGIHKMWTFFPFDIQNQQEWIDSDIYSSKNLYIKCLNNQNDYLKSNAREIEKLNKLKKIRYWLSEIAISNQKY